MRAGSLFLTIQAPVRLRFIVCISISACCGAAVFCRFVIRPVTFLRVLSDLAQWLAAPLAAEDWAASEAAGSAEAGEPAEAGGFPALGGQPSGGGGTGRDSKIRR